MLLTLSCSHREAGRRSAGLARWPILMPVSAVALMTGAPSAAYAQCFGSLNASTSVIGTINTAFLPGGSAFLSSAPNSAPDQQSGGAWTRSVVGKVDPQANTNLSTVFVVPTPNGPTPLPFSQSCRASSKQDYVGFEAGHDIAVLNTNNSDWHFGVLAGYVGVKVESATQSVSGPTQNGDFVAPSAGLYTAFSKGRFSADVQARLYDLQAESLGQRLDSQGYSFAGNMSYSFDLPGNWTLEPSVGGIFSRTSVNHFDVASVAGAIGLPVATLPGLGATSLAAVSGTLQVNDIESALGRASVKLGTSVPLAGGQVVAYPFLTASVFHEFEGNVTASVTSAGTIPTPAGALPLQSSGTITASSIGTYGQFGGGSAFELANTGWLGFARFDYRTGENIQGYSVSAGLRYQFEAENRARYPVKAPVKADSAEGYDWNGPYVGVSAGSTWGNTHWAYQGSTVDPDYAGYLLGGQAGYNFQTGKFVWGIEGDAGLSDARGEKACPAQPVLLTCEDDLGIMGSLTGRFGYTWGRALFYAKGGWEFGQVTAATALNFGAPPAPAGMNAAQSTNWENGWTIGAGMEYALTDRWSAKAEYMHYEFPRYAFTVAQNSTASVSAAGDIVRIGVNYHFGPR
jgi:opacity protein-like surface antigen